MKNVDMDILRMSKDILGKIQVIFYAMDLSVLHYESFYDLMP